ncbi:MULTISPECIES: polysaccharide deacetylase family protein [unclassified Chelatococcus]|uniref:polysaccharide deacetylase family protein n=1 Tax=unclassified Chelatococcus TaxID=2638111 RepID=UPI001BCB7F58|nr:MULTISPECIES: polysaccharide deacetylase family protein [unclassified Chelatococcus]CAH1654571.1 Chitooligosaccharide deacetylase [Hyphomicrobiales bacterium]MBS7742769.1 chitin deacetylase [Chelatococcus sp. HY11]MBX3542113.1 chitin deacetylase [Chelatococcus sp.]MCO5075672.1 polysaccharide deacetylase family protein [Chelatococcus sp.]CAH1694966.1 Chitooligosaccharide deacetylase [Hyphomicrobiales bacterium]
MHKHLQRDFVGYGQNPPHAAWPNEARVAVNFVLNYEEGSEYAIDDGDGRSEKALTEVLAPRVPEGARDLAAESMYEYGSRAGVWRVARQFTERGLPLTVFGCALAFERNPAVAALVRDSGWDVCGHGQRWVEHYLMEREAERAAIRAAVASMTATVGRPLGWYCRYAASINTRKILMEEGGFLYDSDSYADDLPYWVDVDGVPQLVVPYTMVTNDAKILANAVSSGEEFFSMLRDAFDVLRDEGRTHPKMMSVGIHPRILGQPARIAGLARFLDHVTAASDAWICGRADIARHWRERFPPGG